MPRPPKSPETDGLMPFQEIADKLGISYNEAVRTYKGAMRKLRIALEAEGISADDIRYLAALHDSNEPPPVAVLPPDHPHINFEDRE